MQQHPPSRVLICGATAGLAAGAVIAIWFLAVDLLTATAFTTPAQLASLWLGEEFAGRTASLVLTYTILHFGAFAALGMGAAWVLNSVGLQPGLLVGAVFGVGVLNGVYYGGRLVQNVDLLNALPWTHVLGANLAGGMVMMWYLHRALEAEGPLGVRALGRYPILRKGFVTGVYGAAAVALWFLVVDVATHGAFYTPAALGSALFLGASDPTGIISSPAIVGAYTVVHVLAFWTVGAAFVWTAERLEKSPGWWLAALLAFIVMEGLFLGVVGASSEWILGAIAWWAIGLGNLIAVAAMGAWVWKTHPVLQRRLSEPLLDTRV